MASKRARQKAPAKIPPKTAERIVAIALQNPELGARRLIPLLKKKRISVSATSVQNILRRNGLQTRALRLAAAAETTAQPVIFPKKFPDKIPTEVEDRVVALSLENPDLGARRLMYLLQQEDIFVSAASVYKILKRNDIENRPKRLLKIKEQLIPEAPPESEIEMPEPVHVPAHLAPMPPEDEIQESLQDQEELPSLPIEDEIPEPISEPPATAPIPGETEALLSMEEPEPVPEPESPPLRKALLKPIRQKSHWIFYPLYLLLLLLIGYLGFQAVQTIQFARLEVDAVAASDPAGVRPASPSPASIRPLSDYQVIWQRNLFNITLSKESDKKDEISLEKIALAKKDLGLELVGTVVADDPKLSRAIIDNRKTREQEAYREGDSAGKVKIKKILRNNVVITTSEGDELLTVEIRESAKRSASSKPSKSIGSRPSASQQTPRSRPSKASTRSIKLDRDEVEASLSDIEALEEKVRLTPYMQGNQPSGFRISNIPADSILRKMGLRSRDVIVGVDDDEITSPDQASGFFEKLAAGGDVTIKVKRRRRTRQINLSIE
jgi:general secretion pathway protein C